MLAASSSPSFVAPFGGTEFRVWNCLLVEGLVLCGVGVEGAVLSAPMTPRQIDYPEIAESIMPRHRFMSAYEQRIEPPDRRWQYLLMAAEPYETIAFKVRVGGLAGDPFPCSPGH